MLSRGMLFGATPAILTAMALIMIALLTRFAVANRFVFALCLGSLILGLGCGANVVRSIDHYTRTRSYFGIYTVGDVGKGEQKARVFVHGNTSHGFQLLDPALTTYPTSYFAPRAGIGIAMQAAPALFGPHARIGVVGLGAGTLACYAQPGQSWRFYEIDPAVVRIARDPRRFTFLSRCLPGVPVDVGDARLTLATRPTASHDLLTIDAFSSDAIPMHLLTREAFETYARVLVPGGLLMVHISNNYVELQPVLAALAAAKGWHVMVRQYQPDANAIKRRAATSLWVAMSQSRTTIDCLRAADRTAAWKPIAARPGFPVWTDQYGSIVPLLKGF
jgi:spermidine synthase